MKKTNSIQEQTEEMPKTSLANSLENAIKQYKRWENEDPFPSIQPALLNSADILSYIKAVSLIFPFYEKDLSGASYDVGIKGTVVYYEVDKSGEVQKKEVKLQNEGDCFDLQPNSIAFVTLEPVFHIPNYLALRFNLKITHIYKGLLLGTGPLVDPGFVGKLSIPLHNLTNNSYRFFTGDKLITMEFTKMSTNNAWKAQNDYPQPKDVFIPSSIPSNRNVNDYISKALKKDRLSTVVSSIPAAIQESKKDVETSRKAVKDYERRSRIQTTLSLIAVFSLVISLCSLSLTSVLKANDRYQQIENNYKQMQAEYSKKINDLENNIDKLLQEIESLKDKGEK